MSEYSFRFSSGVKSVNEILPLSSEGLGDRPLTYGCQRPCVNSPVDFDRKVVSHDVVDGDQASLTLGSFFTSVNHTGPLEYRYFFNPCPLLASFQHSSFFPQ